MNKIDLERRLIVCRALAMEHGVPLGFHDEQDQLGWDRKAVALLQELDDGEIALALDRQRLRNALNRITALPTSEDRTMAPEAERWRSVGHNAVRIAREALDA